MKLDQIIAHVTAVKAQIGGVLEVTAHGDTLHMVPGVVQEEKVTDGQEKEIDIAHPVTDIVLVMTDDD